MFAMLLEQQSKGLITALIFYPEPLTLAYRCTYTADACCIRNEYLEYWEAKNYWVKKRDDGGIVKLKVAANMYRTEADFYLFEQTKSGKIKISKVETL